MLQPPPARLDMGEDEVETSALPIDLHAFEFNLDCMAGLLAPTDVRGAIWTKRTRRSAPSFVLATAMSTPRKHIAVLDARHKAVAVDCGLPLLW